MPYTTVVAGTTITAAWGNANVRDQVVTPHADASARTTAVTAPVEGMVHHLNDVNCLTVYSGSTWSTVGPVHGSGLTWTPAVMQSGSVTATTTWARYHRFGRMIVGNCIMAITGTGTANNAITVSLPVSANTTLSGGFGQVGAATLYDASSPAVHPGAVVFASSSTVKFGTSNAGAADAYLGQNLSTFAVAVANGDIIKFNFNYEAAADA